MKSIFLIAIIFLVITSRCIAQDLAQTTTPRFDERASKLISAVDTASTIGGNDQTSNEFKYKRDVPWFVEKFQIMAGYYLPFSNTNVSVNTPSGSHGTNIDLENNLGFNTSTNTFLADFQWRSSSRSRFDLSYYGINRSSSYTLQEDIVFGNHTYNANAQINAFFNNSIYRFSYGYAILSKPDYELGLLIGAHIIKESVGLGLNSTNVSAFVQDDFRFTAPLPDFGIWGGYAFNDRWAVNGEADYLSLTIDGIQGRIFAYNASASYKILENLKVALGYTGLNVKVDVTRDKLDGHLRWGYNGPDITATFSFGRKGWE